jgi:hypothetical protein
MRENQVCLSISGESKRLAPRGALNAVFQIAFQAHNA